MRPFGLCFSRGLGGFRRHEEASVKFGPYDKPIRFSGRGFRSTAAAGAASCIPHTELNLRVRSIFTD